MKVRELLSDKSKWTKRAYARNAKGEKIESWNPDAVCFCLKGAINRCYQDSTEHALVADKVENAIARKDGFNIGIACFNDRESTTFSDIKKLVEELDI